MTAQAIRGMAKQRLQAGTQHLILAELTGKWPIQMFLQFPQHHLRCLQVTATPAFKALERLARKLESLAETHPK